MAVAIATSAEWDTAGVSATSYSITLPSGIATGDLLLIFFSKSNITDDLTHTGWTRIAVVGADSEFKGIFARIADGSEGATATFTVTTSTAAAANAYRVTGASSTLNDIEISSPVNSGTTATTANPPSLTTPWSTEESLWFSAVFVNDSAIDAFVSHSSGYSLGQIVNTSGGGASGQAIITSAKLATTGTEDPGVVTWTTARRSDAYTLAIRPSGGVQPYPVVEATAITQDIIATPGTINLPSGITSGDMLFMIIQWKANTSSFSSFSQTWVQEMDSNVTGRRIMMFSRVADGTEGLTTTLTLSASPNFLGAICWRVSGCSSVEVGTAATGTSTSPDPPSLTPSWGSDDTLWASFVGVNDNRQTYTPNSNYNRSLTTAMGKSSSDSTGQELFLSAHRETKTTENPGVGILSGSIAWTTQTIAFQPTPPKSLVFRPFSFTPYLVR